MSINPFPKQKDIVQAVINGMKKAKDNYTMWTRDELYLSNETDNFLSIHIAQEIAKLDNTPEIFLDATISDILKCSLKKRHSFQSFMKKKSISADILSLTLDERFEHETHNDSISRVIMSIKNGLRNIQDEYTNEIIKMCKMLERDKKDDSSLDYAIFAFYLDLSNTARKKTKKRMNEIQLSFDNTVKKYKNLSSYFICEDINIIKNVGEFSIGTYIIETNFNKDIS